MAKLSWLHYPVAALFLGALLLWFGASLRPVESSLQYDFDSWLSSERETFTSIARHLASQADSAESASKDEDMDPVTIALSGALSGGKSPSKKRAPDVGASPPASFNQVPIDQMPLLTAEIVRPGETLPTVYSVSPAGSAERAAQILRLLDLMRESGVFGRDLADEEAAEDEAVVRITVKGPVRTFRVVVPEHEAQEDVRILLLLKLFAEFSARANRSEGEGRSTVAFASEEAETPPSPAVSTPEEATYSPNP